MLLLKLRLRSHSARGGLASGVSEEGTGRADHGPPQGKKKESALGPWVGSC